MSQKDIKLIAAKEKLMLALGDNVSAYLQNIKLWFRQKYTKEEFDHESRKLLDADKIHLHNQFFLALLNKVDTLITTPNSSVSDNISTASSSSAHLGSASKTSNSSSSSSSRKRKRSSRPFGDRVTFEPVKIYEYLPEECSEIVRPPTASGGSPPPVTPQLFAAQELFLPHAGLVMGRLLVGAWENGLMNAEDNAAEYIVTAVQLLLKNIVSSILLKKKHHRVTGGGTFFYDVGAQPKDLLLRNTLTRQHIDDSPIEIDRAITTWEINRMPSIEDAAFLSACEDIYPVERRRISVQDVYNAFLDKNVIPSHGVHSVNFERISQMY